MTSSCTSRDEWQQPLAEARDLLQLLPSALNSWEVDSQPGALELGWGTWHIVIGPGF